MAAREESQGMPKRPWYVTLALIGSFLFAIGAGVEGWDRLRQYQGAETKIELESIRDEAARLRVKQSSDVLSDALYAHKKASYPLHVALFLVSVAMAAFSVRVLFTRAFGRTLLVQLVGVQAALMVARHVVDGETREAGLAFQRTHTQALYAMVGQDSSWIDSFVKIARVGAPVYLGFRTLASLLIIAALLDSKARHALDVADTDDSTSEFE